MRRPRRSARRNARARPRPATCRRGPRLRRRAAECVDFGEHAIARTRSAASLAFSGSRSLRAHVVINACQSAALLARATSMAARSIDARRWINASSASSAVAFEIRPRRDAGDIRIGAGRMAEKQAIERETPCETVLGRRAEARAMCGIESPTCTGGFDPAAQAIDRFGIQIEAPHQRRQRDQIQHFVAGQTRLRQREDAQHELGDRR